MGIPLGEIKRALVINGRACCPRCGAVLCRINYGARCEGIELWCGRSGCKFPVLLSLGQEKENMRGQESL